MEVGSPFLRTRRRIKDSARGPQLAIILQNTLDGEQQPLLLLISSRASRSTKRDFERARADVRRPADRSAVSGAHHAVFRRKAVDQLAPISRQDRIGRGERRFQQVLPHGVTARYAVKAS